MEQPLVNKKYVLEKFPGKGGWTFARIPDIMRNIKTPFGWKKVKGTIDGYEIKKYHLMSMGEGKLFLPVKGEIRKKLKNRKAIRFISFYIRIQIHLKCLKNCCFVCRMNRKR